MSYLCDLNHSKALDKEHIGREFCFLENNILHRNGRVFGIFNRDENVRKVDYLLDEVYIFR